MEHGQQGVQPSFTLGRTWSRLPEDISQRDTLQTYHGNHQRMISQQEVQTPVGKGSQDKGESSHYQSHRRTNEQERSYSDSFSFTRSKTARLSSSFTPFRHQQISDQESPFFTIPESALPDPEAVGLDERSSQEPEIVVDTSNRIRSPSNRNITPTQNENIVVKLESNINRNELWLKMSQFSEKVQANFENLEENNVRLKKLTTLLQAKIKALQGGYAKLSKASEETNKRLNQVLEEQYH
ncbi:hypothetical protein O181_094881 [Austropuccinia psidii MF-1]|uniref:Uncharacterized protein n=1 Tax=Austropuccinia psidii MF-1 TaxID=1389203 RepID=A0A9Q3J4C4_9BASI|nr:hypothetical protein [Austropuccinia psidii MF-1]